MKKCSWLTLGVLFSSGAALAASAVVGWCTGVATSARAWADHLVPFKLNTPTEIRADLLLGRMPEQPSVSSRATVVKLDQRPHLREYLLAQNKFAY